VNVLLNDVVAANPDKVIPVAHLIFHLGQFATVFLLQLGARFDPGRRAVPVNAHGDNVADCTIVKPFDGVEIIGLMTPLQSDADFQILFLRFLGGGKDTANSWGISGHRFFHEYMLTLFNRLLEMDRTKTRRCGQDHQISQSDGLFIGIETDKLVIVRNLDQVRMFSF